MKVQNFLSANFNHYGLDKLVLLLKDMQSPQNISDKRIKILIDDFVLSDSFFDRGWMCQM